MPIAINGSAGTITGVSTGGLPDGSVDADTLASGAVTAAKMASGVGGKILTSGVTGSWSGSTSSTSYVDAATFNCTPSSTSSKILIFAVPQQVQDSRTAWAVQVLRDSTQIYQRDQWKFASTNRNFGIFSVVLLDSPNTTSQITYKIQLRKTTSGGVGSDAINHNGNYVYFEVAG
jgi:hypothetical protein|tara:strand:- start:346 stop:870 length:525 start_codon:yes stop_codon:yes gene_type:complete